VMEGEREVVAEEWEGEGEGEEAGEEEEEGGVMGEMAELFPGAKVAAVGKAPARTELGNN